MDKQDEECYFCEMITWLKNDAKEYKKETNINTHFRVCISEYRVKDGKRKGCTTYRPLKFKYCPMCGVRIKGV